MRKLHTFLLVSMLSFAPVIKAGTNLFNAETVQNDSTGNLPELIVKGNSADKTLTSSTPYKIIDAEAIKITGITDIADAMRRLPGVNLRDYGGAGGLKTISVRGLSAQHTAVVYDGVALSDAQNGQIDLSRYSLDNINSITLLSGDNDDIFLPARAVASASTLNISSSSSTTIEHRGVKARIQMRTGSFGLYNPYFKFSGSNGKNLGFSANAEYLHAKNNYPFSLKNGAFVSTERRENSRMNSWHSELNGIWKPTAASRLTAKFYYYDNDRQLPGPVIYYVNRSNETLRERNFFIQTGFRSRLSSLLSISATAKFNWASSRYKDRDGKYPDGILDQSYIQRETYATYSLLFTPFDHFSFDYSGDWFFNNLSSNLPSDVHPSRNSILQSAAAKYRDHRFNILVRLLYSIYLNHTRADEDAANHSRLSPALSVSYKPFDKDDLYFRISYKNIFRMPTFNEAYFDHLGSVNLLPEDADQLNAGASWNINPCSWIQNLNISVDGYLNFVKNKIVAVPYNMFIWAMTNLGKVRIYGIESTISSEFPISRSSSLLLNATYSYQRAQPRTDQSMNDWMKQMAYTPLNSGSASVSWLNPWVNIALHSTATSAKYTTNANLPGTRIPGYVECGATLFRNFNLKRNSFELRVDILNLFNKQYQIIARYPMPGRSWQVTLKYDLK